MVRFLFPIALAALWIYALVDAIRVSDDSMYREGNKMIWVVVIVFTGPIGAAIYLMIGRPRGASRGRSRGY